MKQQEEGRNAEGRGEAGIPHTGECTGRIRSDEATGTGDGWDIQEEVPGSDRGGG